MGSFELNKMRICLVLVTVAALLYSSYGEKLSESKANFGGLSGINTGEIHEEIYNGLNATKGQFPYQTLQVNYLANNSTTLCGGSLISDRFILTSGHCGYKVRKAEVILGVTDTQKANGAVNYIVTSSNIYPHPQYNEQNYQNDIAILKLPKAVKFTDKIRAIALPRSSWSSPSYFDNKQVTISGWGQTNNNEAGVHPILQYSQVNKMPQSECVEFYKNINTVTDGMICTDKTKVNSGPCLGDAGSPLTIKINSTNLYQIGIFSWGYNKCTDKNPSVYVNLAYYMDWIHQITGIRN